MKTKFISKAVPPLIKFKNYPQSYYLTVLPLIHKTGTGCEVSCFLVLILFLMFHLPNAQQQTPFGFRLHRFTGPDLYFCVRTGKI
jgi:hypothetical protein